MKLLDTIILSISVALFIIGVHQIMVAGAANSYWILMLSVGLLILYRYRRLQKGSGQNDTRESVQKKGKSRKR